MTLESGVGTVPAGVEAGFLFGFGKGKPIGTEFAKGWKYQAPSRPPEMSPRRSVKSQSALAPFWPMVRSDGLPWESEQEPLQVSSKTDRMVDEFLHVAEELVEDTDPQLDVLLASLGNKQEVTSEDLDPILAILSSSVQRQDGSDIMRAFQTLIPRKVTGTFWKRFAYMLRSRVIHGSLSTEEVLSIFKLNFDCSENWEFSARRFAKQIAQTDIKGALIDITEYVLSSPNHKAKVKSWLQILRSFHPEIKDGHKTSPSWERLHSILAQHFQPSDQHVLDHFGKLKRSEFAQVLFEFYLPTWLAESEREARVPHVAPHTAIGESERPIVPKDVIAGPLDLTQQVDPIDGKATSIDCAEAKAISLPRRAPHENFTSSSSDSRIGALSAWTRAGELKIFKARFLLSSEGHKFSSNGGYTDPYAIVDLVALLARRRIPYTRLLDEVFEVYTQTQSTNITKNFFLKLRSHKECDIPTSLAEKLMQHFLASGEHAFAFYVFRSMPTLPLLPYADLLIKLIENGKTHGEKIFEMLLRYHPDERIPVERRENRRLGIKQEHVDLVHNVAYAFASSKHLSPRTAFRRVWECYRFLRDRRAPLQPLISRALVKAGLSRPLTASARLSETQVKYILSVVEQVEGLAIAKEVDRIVWDAWEWTLRRQWAGSLVPPAKGPEGQGQAYEKKRRLWMKSGGRVYVPRETFESIRDGRSVENNSCDKDDEVVADSRKVESKETTDSAQRMTARTAEIHSSLTEMDTVVDGLPPPRKPINARRTAQFTPFQSNANASETPGEAAHDTALSEPSEPSEADVCPGVTSRPNDLAHDRPVFRTLDTARLSTEPSMSKMNDVADGHPAFRSLDIARSSTEPSTSEMNDVADYRPIPKILGIVRPSTDSTTSSQSIVSGTVRIGKVVRKHRPLGVNDLADDQPISKTLSVARPSTDSTTSSQSIDFRTVRTGDVVRNYRSP